MTNQLIESYLFPLQKLFLFKGARKTLNIFEPRYVELLNDSLLSGKDVALGCAFTENIEGMLPLKDAHHRSIFPLVGFGQMSVVAKTKEESFIVVVKGQRRGRIKEIISSNTPYFSVLIEELPYMESVSSENYFMFRRIKQMVEQRVHQILDRPKEVELLLAQLQTPAEVISFYSDHFISDLKVKIDLMSSDDINEQIVRISQMLLSTKDFTSSSSQSF